jgi:hypothetical protein
MTLSSEIRAGIQEIGLAVRHPEAFAQQWRDRHVFRARPSVMVPVLIVNAMLGFAAYGLTIGLHNGALAMLEQAVLCAACGTAWLMAFPALYVINSLLGSKLNASTTMFAALVTISFGALAMLASVPVSWFFAVTLPSTATGAQLVVQVIVFAGISFCMVDVFLRVMRVLDPHRQPSYAFVWLCLVGTLGVELMNLLGAGPFALAH